MDQARLHRFISAMPKAELHLHIEGTLEPEMMMELAKRNGVTLQTRQDFFDLAFAYLTRMAAQNVTHVEVFFDPQGHTGRGVSFDTVLSGLTDAFDRARREFGITSKLIMCFLRHLSEEQALDTLGHACHCKAHIFGVGLDSSEKGNPPSKFARVYAQARQEGFVPVAHAGEEGPPAYVCEAIDLLKVRRIDHGNRALEDPSLVARIAREQIPMTICPLSNKRLQVCPDLKLHPLRRMLEAGLLVTVNSDDPSYFGGYVNENFVAVQEALALTAAEIATLARNSFIASFMTDTEKAAALAAFDTFQAKW
jgi:adenosine deaminase